MKREHFEPGPSSVLCSDHFEEECFEYQNFTNRRQLKAGSIPTIFGFTKIPSSRRIQDRCEPSTSAELFEPPVSNEANAAMATEEIQAEIKIIDLLAKMEAELIDLKATLKEKEFVPENVRIDVKMKALTNFVKIFCF
ncbi:THAP domain-containing protein 3 [Trichonephila clavipes]|nr:THAP domain-containing protein 3 [Trichonephila clavipes]